MTTKRQWYSEEELVIRRAAERVGGLRRLSALMGLSHNTVAKWKRVPAEQVPKLSEITGVPRHVFRPDLWEDTEGMKRIAQARRRQAWAAMEEA